MCPFVNWSLRFCSRNNININNLPFDRHNFLFLETQRNQVIINYKNGKKSLQIWPDFFPGEHGSCPQGQEPSAVSGLSQGPPEPVSWLLPAPNLTPRGTTKDLISLSAFSIWEAELRMLATGGQADRGICFGKASVPGMEDIHAQRPGQAREETPQIQDRTTQLSSLTGHYPMYPSIREPWWHQFLPV